MAEKKKKTSKKDAGKKKATAKAAKKAAPKKTAVKKAEPKKVSKTSAKAPKVAKPKKELKAVKSSKAGKAAKAGKSGKAGKAGKEAKAKKEKSSKEEFLEEEPSEEQKLELTEPLDLDVEKLELKIERTAPEDIKEVLTKKAVRGVPLTRYERARIVSARALQISMGAPPLVRVPKGVFKSEEVAMLEYENKSIPLNVIRSFPDGTSTVIEFS